MKNSTHLASFMVRSIIEKCESIDFSRANFRANSGDIILEITAGDSKAVMNIESQNININRPKILESFLTIEDSDFALSSLEITSINLSDHIIEHFASYCEQCVWGPSKSYKHARKNNA